MFALLRAVGCSAATATVDDPVNRKDRPTVDGVSECCSHHGVVFRDVSTAGDRMLQQVVDAIRGVLRSFDLIIRYGGDEFICAFPGITMADV